MTDQLKIMALDADDLAVISAHVQDAVLKGGDIVHRPNQKQLVLSFNRFAWEAKPTRRWFLKKHERRLSVLHFSQVEGVKSKGIQQNDKKQILSILAITFKSNGLDGDPSGTLEITFSGGAAMIVDVECIEAQLTDLGATWAARGKPRHGG